MAETMELLFDSKVMPVRFILFSELWAIRRKQCLRVESKISCVHALSSSKLPHESLTHAPLVPLGAKKKKLTNP
jgi:hypothetical protein